MGLTYVAKLPILGLCPIVGTAFLSASGSVAANFHGALAVNAEFSATPPDVPAVLAEMSQFNADVSGAISLSLPSISFDLSACTALTAGLNLSVSTLPTLEALIGDLSVGIFSYAYAGTANVLGAALTSDLSSTWGDGTTPTSSNCTALIFGLVDDVSLTPTNISTLKYGEYLTGLTFGGAGLVYEGKLTLTDLVGGSITADAFAQASTILTASLSAAASLQASLAVTPPTLAADLAASIAAAADLTALPSPAVTIAASAAFAADLNANFSALIFLGDILSRNDAQAFVYIYTGPANALGAAVTTALGTHWGDGTTLTSGACTAVVLGAVDAGSIAALTSFFGGA